MVVVGVVLPVLPAVLVVLVVEVKTLLFILVLPAKVITVGMEWRVPEVEVRVLLVLLSVV